MRREDNPERLRYQLGLQEALNSVAYIFRRDRHLTISALPPSHSGFIFLRHPVQSGPKDQRAGVLVVCPPLDPDYQPVESGWGVGGAKEVLAAVHLAPDG
jgi:hypothetical protein